MSTRDIDRGWKRIVQNVRGVAVSEVIIGIQEGEVNDGQSIAEYAACNEFGTEKIPERSFMRSTFDENVDNIQSEINTRYDQVLAGQLTTRKALGLVGMHHQDQIKHKISNVNILPKLAPSTIDKKGSNKTLIDTGAMNASVHYAVRGRT